MVDLPPPTLYEVQHVYEIKKSKQDNLPPNAETVKEGKNEAAGARAQALYSTALGVGVKAGMAWQLSNIKKAIAKQERDLDTIYNFSNYMIQERVVPAVISEAKDLYNQDGDYALRLSGAYYTIVEQPRFSSVPPSWRGYLDFPAPELDRLTTLLMPKTDEERHVWQVAVKDGWEQGVEQGNLMLNYGLDRLNRDFVGMIRFHQFVKEGKITMPAIASESIAMTKGDKTIALDEQLLRITTLPEFSSMNRWRASIRSSGISPDPASTPSGVTP